MNDKLLCCVAEKYGTEKNEVASEIEMISESSEILKGMTWDEIVTFFACLTIHKAGYISID